MHLMNFVLSSSNLVKACFLRAECHSTERDLLTITSPQRHLSTSQRFVCVWSTLHPQSMEGYLGVVYMKPTAP